MSDLAFAPDWLDLREPADHAARDTALLAQAFQTVSPGAIILDLGSGTGSTARAFNRIGPSAAWRFLDDDEQLLGIAKKRHPDADAIVATLRSPEAIPLDGVGMVTASALLDLMPTDWIEALARRLRRAGIPFYAALNYNGDMTWTPALPDDASIVAAFNRHQRGDKGLGPATGPAAASVTLAVFERNGYQVTCADSPWKLGPQEASLQSDLLEGIAAAAREAGHGSAGNWLTARRAALGHGTARIGHTDVLATLR